MEGLFGCSCFLGTAFFLHWTSVLVHTESKFPGAFSALTHSQTYFVLASRVAKSPHIVCPPAFSAHGTSATLYANGGEHTHYTYFLFTCAHFVTLLDFTYITTFRDKLIKDFKVAMSRSRQNKQGVLLSVGVPHSYSDCTTMKMVLSVYMAQATSL